MTPEEITTTLRDVFGEAVQIAEPNSWQIEAENFRLLILLSEDQSWLRSLITIAPIQQAQPYLEQLLEANFDDTQEARYALYQNVLWAVFQHSRISLTTEDFQAAIARLIALHSKGLSDSFDKLAETQIRMIVRAAKQQGQSMETTLQNIERFYQEGVMGDIDQKAPERNQVIGAWRYQLERLWNEEEG